MEVSTSAAVSSLPFIVNPCSIKSAEITSANENFFVSACGTFKDTRSNLTACSPNVSKQPDWNELHRAACRAFNGENFEQAACLWTNALSLLEFAPYTDNRLINTLDYLVETYQLLKNYGEAEKYCLRALEVKRVAYDNWDIRVADCLNMLAGIYYSSKQYGKVEKFCLEAELIYAKLQDSTCESVGVVAENLAYLYYSQNKFQQAQKRFRQAILIKRGLLPDGHPDLIKLFQNYAIFLAGSGCK